jgi:von Willebrand factor type A domain
MKSMLIPVFNREQREQKPNRAMTATVKKSFAAVAVAAGLALQPAHAASGEEGIALAIIYDTSGSMRERVPAGPDKTAPKYIIANKALGTIVDRISEFATNAPAGTPRKIETGLYIFRDPGAAEVVKYGPFDGPAIKTWVQGFSRPNGATPLGNAITVASQAVLKSGLTRKHIVIITDGINTSGPKPEAVIPGIQQAAAQQQSGISFHFVAFDVDARVFDSVKKLGATVLAAANEQQLNSQLQFIFERKILLEDEEPARPAADKTK